MLSFPDNKEELEKVKLKEEIKKIEVERSELAKGKIRFLLASVFVPLFVATVTGFLLYFTGILDTRKKLNELNRLRNEQEKSRFSVEQDSMKKADSIINFKNDSITRVNRLLTSKNDSLVKIGQLYQQSISRYQALIKSGLSRDQQVNILIIRNDSLSAALRKSTSLWKGKVEKLTVIASNYKQYEHAAKSYDSLELLYNNCQGALIDAGSKLGDEQYARFKESTWKDQLIQYYKDTVNMLRNKK